MQLSHITARATSLLLGISVLAVALLAIGPHTGAYRTLTILSGSMEPRFAAGDVVVVVPVPTSSLRVGDVVTYEAPTDGAPIVTHRIVEIVEHGTRPVIRTKGDANEAADPWDARLTDTTAWRQVAVVPFLGSAIRAVRHDVVLDLARYGVPLVLLGLFLFDTWRPRNHPAEEDLAYDADLEWAPHHQWAVGE